MQRVTTKDPKKVEVGKRFAAHNHRKRELKAQKREDPEGPATAEQGEARGVSQYYGIGAVLAVGVIGGLGCYIYRTKKAQQPSHLQ